MEITRSNRCGAENSNVLAMWNKFFAICECIPLKTLTEAEEMFAGFEPLQPGPDAELSETDVA